MTRATRAAEGIIGWFRRDDQSNWRKWISPGVGASGWVAAIVGQRPVGNAPIVIVGVLQMADPGGETCVLFDEDTEPLAGVGTITRNLWAELRDEAGVVELLFSIDA